MIRKRPGHHSALAVRQEAMVLSAQALKPLWEKEKLLSISDCEVSPQLLNLLKVCGLASFTALACFGSGEPRSGGYRQMRPDFLQRLGATVDESLALEYDVAPDASRLNPEEFLKRLEVDMVVRASLKATRTDGDSSVANSPRRLHSALVGGSSGGVAQCLHVCAKNAIRFAFAHTSAGDEAELPLAPTGPAPITVSVPPHPSPPVVVNPGDNLNPHRQPLTLTVKEKPPAEVERHLGLTSPAQQVSPQALYNSAASIVEQSIASKTIPPNIHRFITSWTWNEDHSVSVVSLNAARGIYDIRYRCNCSNEIRLQQAPENRNRVNGRAIKRHWLGTSPTAGPSCGAIREFLEGRKQNSTPSSDA